MVLVCFSFVGKNRLGKSNLMDAISFVFGINSKQLRSGKLKDLVYASSTDDIARSTAKVELFYLPSDSVCVD